jgi:hypothetical protein
MDNEKIDFEMPELNEFDLNVNFDSDIFDSMEIDLDRFETRYIKPPRTRQVAMKYARAEKLARDITISHAQRTFIVINGTFIFGDFIEALILEKNYQVKEMTISTLSLSENNVDSLANLLEHDYILSLNLIISDYFFSHERSNLIPYIYKELDKKNNFQLAIAATHCKICIFETTTGEHIVIHGSCNLRSSNNIEQLVVEESKELYDFNKTYQDEILKRYSTIHKSIRQKEIWQVVAKEKAEAVEEEAEAAKQAQVSHHLPKTDGRKKPSPDSKNEKALNRSVNDTI